MKVKTSITLSEDLLRAIDERAGHKNRSGFIEATLRACMAQLARNEQKAGDVEIINRRADDLNREAEDVLAYQARL
jgi:metal-responsive CopG/Arc/MetJ family transcriptional regulator